MTVADLLAAARRPLVLTGAGVSATAGRPTYRGPDGAGEASVVHHPGEGPGSWDEVWAHWGPLRDHAGGPGPAHEALARWGSANPWVTVVTQNVDGLHRLAGTRVCVELHGSVWRSRCTSPRCGTRPWSDEVAHLEAPPCPRCGAPARPDVVLPGEEVPAVERARARHAAAVCDVLVVVGTSGAAEPANTLPGQVAGRGVPVVRLDPGHWDGPDVDWAGELCGPVDVLLADVLPR